MGEYRDYETTNSLEKQLAEKQKAFDKNPSAELYEDIQYLKDRIRFGYDDEEFEENEEDYTAFLGESRGR